MSDYGLKILNYEAGSIYEVMSGVRNNYDTQPAMFTNSLFSDFIRSNGLNVYKEKSTRDIICIEFNYGSRDYESEIKHLKKLAVQNRLERKIAHGLKDEKRIIASVNKKKHISSLYLTTNENKDKYDKKSADEIRTLFYTEGVTIRYPKFNKNKEISGYDNIQYKMLYRTPGKAKKGTCMFIKKSLYNKAHEFLWMGLKLPKKNAPIVEIGAYSSLITSTIEDKIKIQPEDILILKDIDSFFTTDIISVETNSEKQCVAVPQKNYTLKNTIFDGQALIDESIFPSWGNGYILLRHHFTKMAAFSSNIQLFFKDYFGDKYESATVVDMWGNEHLAKDIKLITTDNAIKWIKFNITYEYWCDWVHKNGDMFGIVKTAHPSKLGNVQRMSYQMVNSLNEEIMEDVLSNSKKYIWQLKTDDSVFIDFLKRKTNFSNDYEVLAALCEQNPEFVRCDYFRDRKKEIIRNYVNDLKNGRVIQNADNLTIVGSPYAMLLHSVGEDISKDPTFSTEDDSIQCWTSKFDDGEYVASFRSPFNSQNNLGYMHNHYHPFMDKYFNLGKLCVAVNMINTCFQDRNNGSDQDSDSIYTTNQPQIVEHAKYCYKAFPTIVNNIPKEKNNYDNTLEDFAKIDNKLAAAQLDIGESSNLAQVCLSYSFTDNSQRLKGYICILAVLAQVSIDNAKRSFDVNVGSEIKRIKKEINLKENKYPAFWLAIRKDFDKSKINKSLRCPMNCVYNIKLPSYQPSTSTLPISEFFVKHEYTGNKRIAKKVEKLIEEFSLESYSQTIDSDTNDYFLLRNDFDEMISRIRELSFPEKYISIVSWLLDRAFKITPQMVGKSDKIKTLLDKNKSLLMKTLYEVSPKTFKKCFKSVPTSKNESPFFSVIT